jgi:hypothetical protein
MRTTTEGERVRRALATREFAELEWALGYTRERVEGSASEGIRGYWVEIVRRIEEALAAR